MYSRSMVGTLRRAIAERDIQLVEVEESFGMATWLQRALSIPVCVRLHGPWFLNGPAVGVPEDVAFRHRVSAEGRAIADAVALTSSSLDVLERTRAFYGLALEQAEVIHPPTTPVPAADRWRSEGCDPKQILFIGRFDRHKGGDLIIEAFGRVLHAVPDARLCFVGARPGVRRRRRAAMGPRGIPRRPAARGGGVGPGDAPGAATVLGPGLAAPPGHDLRDLLAVRERPPRPDRGHVPGLPDRRGTGRRASPRSFGTALTDCCTAAAIRRTWRPRSSPCWPTRPGPPSSGARAAARCEREFHPVAIASRTVDYYRRVLQTTTTTRTE